MQIDLGNFVESTANNLGVGRLSSLDGKIATISYFDSPLHEVELHAVHIKTISTKTIHPQTRIYFHNPEQDTWVAGRVITEIENNYLIQLPNKEKLILPGTDFHVRWNKALSNPAALLAVRINETPYFHSGRHPFMASLTRQRAACAGMSGLFSAVIELEEHQVEVVRRVLQDPVQRYLLADEVGLGKTIEAAAIIRQYVLDYPSTHCVLIILPAHLLDQWRDELCQKFFLDEWIDKTIHLVSHSDIDGIRMFGEKAGMVVIDEAHHIAALASSSCVEETKLFETTRTVAHTAERLLLLSATPVLHNERSFLAMLHLLDPAIYSLEGLDEFRARIEQRQEVAELFNVLKEESPNYFIEGILDDLHAYFPKDHRLLNLIGDLRPHVDFNAPEDTPDRSRCIQAIRVHVSEVYRLHRRLLRNRRTGTLEVLVPGRAGLERVQYEDPYLPWLEQALDEWRVAALSTVHGQENSERATELAALGWFMLELAACDPMVLRKAVSVRLGMEADLSCLDSSGIRILNAVPVFEEENTTLRGILEALKGFSDSRLDALVQYFTDVADKDSRHIVFATFPETADKIYNHLVSSLGRTNVDRHHAGFSGWQKSECRILVCDRDAEEGLNLQGDDTAMIHFDLPFSPNRIEQRIGRLDRFGVAEQVRSLSLETGGAQVATAWMDFLDNALGVFSRSVASLQYVVEDRMTALSRDFFTDGVDALRAMTSLLGGNDGLLASELKRIKLQDEFDALEADRESDREFYDNLWEVDQEWEIMATTADQWLVERLQFIRQGADGPQDKIFSYQYRSPDNRRSTLVPADELINRFRSVIDIEHSRFDTNNPYTFPMTFKRQTACKRGVRLARLGEPFIEAMLRYIQQDDRGVSFAMWRHIPRLQIRDRYWLGFRFDFIIEADYKPARGVLEGQPTASLDSLTRNMDALLPPVSRTIWLNEELQVVTQKSAIGLLSKPYSNGRQAGSYKDYNLNPSRWRDIESLIDPSSWHSLCQAAHAQARIVLREDPTMQGYLGERLAHAKQITAARLEQLRSRLDHLGGRVRDAERHQVEQEELLTPAILRGVEAPVIVLDAAGAIFLSSENPFPEGEF